MKNIVGKVFGVVPLEYLVGKKFREQLNFLQESQWWSYERARKYQLTKISEICTLAFNNSSYYRNLFLDCGFHPRDIKKIRDFQRLPCIDKLTISKHLMNMLTMSIRSSRVDYITTGGTSGIPLKFYINSSRSQIEYAYLVASWQRSGYQLGDTMAVFRGKLVSQDRSGVWQEYDPVFRQQFYSTFHMSDIDMQRYVEHMRTIGSCFLHVYPSSVFNLARFLRRNNIQPPKNILGIIAESEIVYPEQREMVEEVFGCRYFSSYGHTEKLVAAAGCEKSNNYHVWPTYGFFELLDDDDNPVTTPGQRGEIVGTGFINTVVPFIRYRTGDYATYIGDHCPECGRNHLLISNIEGHRTQENLITRDGSLISWTSLNMHDDTFDDVLQMQFYQDTPGEAILKIVPAHSYTKDSEFLIYKNIGKKLGDNVTFTIKQVDSISLTNRGKSVFVDQQIRPVN